MYDSPRGFINKKDYKSTIEILEGIAFFNGKLDEFRESLKQEEYQDIISAIKGEDVPEIKSEEIEMQRAEKEIYSNDNNNEQENEENKENKEIDENEENKENKEKEEIKENEEKKENEENKIDINQNLDIYRESHNGENINKDNDKDNMRDTKKDNNKDISEPLIRKSTGRKSKIQDINIWSLFKYRSIRYKFMVLNILWIGTRTSFNGISISSKSFRGNFYLNIIILYIIESIAYCIAGCIINIKALGRKGSLWIMYSFIIASFFLLAFIEFDVVPELILNYIARFCAAGIEVVYYTYSIEVYPTLVRSVAFGVNLTFGNAGSIIAPLILEYLDNWVFLTVFGIVCIINFILLFCLPETVGKPMIETIKELDD